MELTFSIDEHPITQRRPGQAASRWLRSFLSHSPNVAFKPSPFTVEICSERGEHVKAFPAVSREEADDLLERLEAECRSAGVHDFLVRHGAPDHFVKRAARPS